MIPGCNSVLRADGSVLVFAPERHHVQCITCRRDCLVVVLRADGCRCAGCDADRRAP